MIYNYENGSPVLVTQEVATHYFPEFNFDDDYIFFIYPADSIIYNYTLGVFFELEDDNQYNEILLPIILGPLGDFIGCTQADNSPLPTLYYQNGRLTLQHQNCRNIGWHPRKQGYNYIFGNILSPNNPKMFANGTVFNIHQFNHAVAAVNDHNIDEAQLIELYYDADNVIVSRHVSRSFLKPNLPIGFQLEEVNEFMASNELNYF